MTETLNKILIIGRGVIGKALAEHLNCDLIPAAEFRLNTTIVRKYDAVVNCAAVVGTGTCDRWGWEHVAKANVAFPKSIQSACRAFNVKDIQISTVGVYRNQVSPQLPEIYVDEDSEVFPHNIYTASKLLMEQMLWHKGLGKTIVLRLGFFASDEQWYDRVINWKEVQDTWSSYTTVETLANAICKAIELNMTGLFNITSGEMYLPQFIDELRERMQHKLHPVPEMTIRKEYPSNMTSAVPVSSEKAWRLGLL